MNTEGLLGAYFFKQPRLDIYEENSNDNTKKWRWRIWMSSDIVAASSQGYATRKSCVDNIRKIAGHIIELDRIGKLI